MAKATVEVLVDDLDGSEAVETIQLGWNGEWRELDLSKRNRAGLTRVFDKYWNAARPTTENAPRRRKRRAKAAPRKASNKKRDPKAIRAWANDNGVPVPAKGRIPADVERQFHEAQSVR